MVIIPGPIVSGTAAWGQLKGWTLTSVEGTITDKFERNLKSSEQYYFKIRYVLPEQSHMPARSHMDDLSVSVTERIFRSHRVKDPFWVYYYPQKPEVLYQDPARAGRAAWFFRVSAVCLPLFLILLGAWIWRWRRR